MEKKREEQILLLAEQLSRLTQKELRLIRKQSIRLKGSFDIRRAARDLKNLASRLRRQSLREEEKLKGLADEIIGKLEELLSDYKGLKSIDDLVMQEHRILLSLDKEEDELLKEAREDYSALDESAKRALASWLGGIRQRMKEEHIIKEAHAHLNDIISGLRQHQESAVTFISGFIRLLKSYRNSLDSQSKRDTGSLPMAEESIFIRGKQLYDMMREEKEEIIDPLEKFIKVKKRPAESAEELIKEAIGRRSRFFGFFRKKKISQEEIEEGVKSFSRPDEVQKYLLALSRHPGVLSRKAMRMLQILLGSSAEKTFRLYHRAKLSGKDELTSLMNRREFNQRLAAELSKVRRSWQGSAETYFFSLIMFDIDHFKQFNDTYGHDAGDEVLITAARTVSSALRRGSDMLFRTGGEEFHIILCGAKKEKAAIFADTIRKMVASQTLEFMNTKRRTVESCRITISMGVADSTETFDSDRSISDNERKILKLADERLYRAKQKGRNITISSP